MQLMSGVCYYRDAMGLKVYTSYRSGTRFMVLLFSAETGDLLAIVQADNLGRMRTGAASGVATKYLANEKGAGSGGYDWVRRSGRHPAGGCLLGAGYRESQGV